MTELQKIILTDIAAHQPTKARQIAERLCKSRKEINHELYGDLKAYVQQDGLFDWRLNKLEDVAGSVSVNPPAVKQQEPRERICRNCCNYCNPDKCDHLTGWNAENCKDYIEKPIVDRAAYDRRNEEKNSHGKDKPEKNRFGW